MITRRMAKAYAPAVFLSDTLDWLGFWQQPEPAAGDEQTGERRDTGPNHLSQHL